MVTYEKFWELLKQRHISLYQLMRNKELTADGIQEMKHNQYVRTSTIDRLCRALSCRPEDIFDQDREDYELQQAVFAIREEENEANGADSKRDYKCFDHAAS